jgi:hypothetical protein
MGFWWWLRRRKHEPVDVDESVVLDRAKKERAKAETDLAETVNLVEEVRKVSESIESKRTSVASDALARMFMDTALRKQPKPKPQ